jgi:hypothetical protein
MWYQISPSLEERVASLFQPDPLLPAQYLDIFKSKPPLDPEKTLMLAVLEDAVTCIRKYRSSSLGKGKRLFHDARDWIFADEEDWPFSFINVCETLGLNPGYLRSAFNHIIDMKEKKSAKFRKPKVGKPSESVKRQREKLVRPAA